jgi:hypothetical protein
MAGSAMMVRMPSLALVLVAGLVLLARQISTNALRILARTAVHVPIL